MDSDDLYDEFGNFIGDANDSDADSDYGAAPPSAGPSVSQDMEDEIGGAHESGEYAEPAQNGRDHETSMGQSLSIAKIEQVPEQIPEVETIVVDPTAQGSDEPVIKPVEHKNLRIEYKTADNSSLPETTYSKEYLHSTSKNPARVRNVAVVGNLHTGKTSLVDLLVLSVHPGIRGSKKDNKEYKPLRYLDTHKLEHERGVSIHASAVSLLVPDARDRSHALNIVDCPGHPDFRDELRALLSVADGVVFVVDVVEGLTGPDKKIVSEAMRRDLPLVVVLNKIDRLVLELRLPPRDAFHKIKHVLSAINSHIYHNEYAALYTQEKLVSPLKGNVVFASHALGAAFTLASWSRLYADAGNLPVDEATFAQLLWGDIYFAEGKFSRCARDKAAATTFEHFVLEPMYKLVAHTLVAEAGEQALAQLLWEQFGVALHKACYQLDPQALLREVFCTIFPDPRDLVQLIVASIGSPQGSAVLRSRGVDPDQLGENDAVAEIFKMQLSLDAQTFECLTKVHRGVLRVGDRVHVIGSSYAEDKADLRTEEITSIHIPVGRYKIAVEEAHPGSIVSLGGICGSASKGATLFSQSVAVSQLTPIHTTNHGRHSFYKVAVECENPAELPRLVAGLQKLAKGYVSATTRLEESGEHVVLAPGELYLDCFLHDLRFSGDRYLSLKISDPMVKFAETCMERSVTKIAATTPAKTSLLSVTAEPAADKRLLQAIEQGRISLAQPARTTAKVLREEFGWDALAARSVWSFGPKDMQNPSILLDDTIDGETDKAALGRAKDLVTAGFRLGVNEGPLCDEPVRRTTFKILDAVLSGNVQNSGGQIIPMTRNAVHCGLLTAAPRLLEPMYRVHVTCTYKCVSAVYTILEKRRGWGVSEEPVAGTQLYEIEGCVPMIDSVGLDTDMRLYTQGQAFCSLEFFRWDVVPGDPLDTLCPLPQMKPVPRGSLARDFVLKTRKRKGLSGEPNLQKYIDPELYVRLQQSGIVN